MPRDFPPIAEPAIKLVRSVSNTEPTLYQFGGLPRLPDNVEWPCDESGTSLHFFAEIDLSAVPRSMEQADQILDFPNLPETGTMFVFLALDGERNLNGLYSCAVRYTPDTVDRLPETPCPHDLPSMTKGEVSPIVSRTAAKSNQFLEREFRSPENYLSFRAENPLWRNMERDSLSPQEMYERDLAYAQQLNALNIEYPLPAPPEPADPRLERVPDLAREWFEQGGYEWTWSEVESWSADLVCEIYSFISDRICPSDLQRRMELYKLGKSIKLGAYRSTAFSWLQRRKLRPANEIDAKLQNLLFHACRQKGDVIPDAEKTDFLAFLSEIEGWKGDPTELRLKYTSERISKDDVRAVCVSVFENWAHAHLQVGEDRTPAVINFGEDDRAAQITQMFGLGYLMQNAAVEHEDKVLLLQITDVAGVKFSRIDGIYQIWIAHEALAAGHFEKAFGTMECT